MSGIKVGAIGVEKHFSQPPISLPKQLNSAKRKLFGNGPTRDQMNKIEEDQKRENIDKLQKYIVFESTNDLSPPLQDGIPLLNLIEKEAQEFSMQLSIKTLHCMNSTRRGKPCSIDDYYGKRKRVSSNKNNNRTSSEENSTEYIHEILTIQIIPDQGLERVGNDSNSSVNSNTANIINNNTEPNISASINTTTTAVGIPNEISELRTPPRDHQQSQEQISLHTKK